MPLSWNEIRHNAIRFAKDWADVKREESEKQTFWNEFFAAFGINRRAVASFEVAVRNINGQYGFIDGFWPGVVLIEHKSFGKDLGKAHTQAAEYIADLARDDVRRKEIPRYILVSDFARIALHDLEDGTSVTFPLSELPKHIHAFAFIPGYKQHKFKEEDPINIKAAEVLGDLHDVLEAGGFSGHDLERFLVRILFCLFAEDTGLFPRRAFELYLEEAFTSERQRVEFLFALYEKLTAPLVAAAKPKRAKRAKGLYFQPPPAPPPASSVPDSEPAIAVFHTLMGKEEPPPYRVD